ncbi:hypothetical protein BDQ17DRAFT_1421775 [Cyathus striatus]|nr:hypothetical protein BDQ17DRAFT_1421775 [Cyathus striatus]
MPPASSSSSAPLTKAQKQEALKQRRERRAELAAIQRSDVEMWKNEGNESFKKGQYADAVEKYEEAIIIGGEKALILSNLAAAHLKLGQYEGVAHSANKALAHDPKNLKARFRRATALKELNQFTAALAGFTSRLLMNKTLLWSTDEEDDSDDEKEDRLRKPRDYFSDSDTSDCLHIGNGTPCRFYNKGLCNKGEQCSFSHAPDDRSVRDGLGRNVCKYFIMHACKYGSEKCVYSHSREFLPPGGWWEDYKDANLARYLQQELRFEGIHVEPPLPSPESLAHELRVSLLGAAHHWSPYKELAKSSLDMNFRKRRSEIRKKVRARAKEKASASATTSAQDSGTSGVNPFAVVLSLEHEQFYNNILSHLLSSLRETMEVKQAFSRDAALAYLSQPGLKGVYVMDVGIISARNAAVRKRLFEFVTKEGGRVCVGGMFPNNIGEKQFEEFFKGWGLQWKYGSYHRTTFLLNSAHPLAVSDRLFESYSMKALHVDNVSPFMMLYTATEDSRLESHVFLPVKIETFDESPAVAAKVGKGWIGFVGDVNGELGSTRTVMAMLGVLDDSKLPKVIKREMGKSVPERTNKTEDKKAGIKAKGNEESMEGGHRMGVAADYMRTREPSTKHDTIPPPDSPFLLILTIHSANKFQETHKAQIDALSKKCRVEFAVGRHYALQYLSNPHLEGVYVADDTFFNKTLASPNSDILTKIVSFAKGGGTVVVSGLFPTTMPETHIPGFFKSFGLEWTVGRRRKAEWYLESRTELGKWNPSLPDTYPAKALALTNVDQKAAVYFPPPEESGFESPVVRTKVGKRYLGYVGYESPEEPMGSNIILAMFNRLGLDYALGPPQPTSRKFVMMLSFDRVEQVKGLYSGLISDLQNRVEVLHGLSNERVLDFLGSNDLVGVIIMTTDITDPPHAYLLQQLVQYTRNGGTTIFAGYFACEISLLEVRPFFEDNWGLPWDMGSSNLKDINMKLNKKSDFAKNDARNDQHTQLPEQIGFRAVNFTGVKESMILYKDKYAVKKDELAQVPIAVAPVGKGWLGWLGSASSFGVDDTKVMLVMLGL